MSRDEQRAVSPHGGDRVAETLVASGVRTVFTLCGGHVSPILTGCRQRGLRIVDVRDEATAVFAADASARLGGTPGVAVLTAGPGLTNTITAVKNAQLAQSPTLILGGAAPTVLKGRGALQDIDQLALMRPHVKHARAVRRVRDLAPAVEQALAVARAGVPGPAFVECPIDLLYPEALIRGWYLGSAGAKGRSLSARLLEGYLRFHLRRLFTGPEHAPRPPPAPAVQAPPARAVTRVSAALAAARRPLLLIGSQALVAAAEAAAVAAAVGDLGLPVYLTGMARGLLGRNHPRQFRHQRRAALRAADCVILAGVPCDFRLDYGRQIRRGATLISVNLSDRDRRLNRRPDLGIRAAPGGFLVALAAAGAHPRPDWVAELRGREEAREGEIQAAAAASSEHVNPLALLSEIERVMPDEATIVADGGDFVATAAAILRPRAPLSWLDPGPFGTLGVGAGFALAARLARPEHETWLLYGDGACGYSLIEFETLARLALPVIAVVGNDACWSQIAREQVKILGDDVATGLSRTAYHRAAEGLGARGLLLDDPARIGEVLAEARRLAAGGHPVLVNALIGTSSFRDGAISM